MRRRTDVYIGHMRDGSAIAVATYAATTAIRDGDPASARATLRDILGEALPALATAAPAQRDVAERRVSTRPFSPPPDVRRTVSATRRTGLAAHGDLAVTLHAAGDCLTGRQILHRTGELARSTYGPGDPLGIRMRDRLADLTPTAHRGG